MTAVVGPGILTLPGAAAQIAGPLSLLALALLLAISVPSAFAFVHIHRATTTAEPDSAAGIQHYVTTAFGPRAGRITAAWFYLGVPIGVPALALIGGAYVSAAVGGGRTTQLLAAWTIAAVAILANLRTRRSGGTVSLVLAAALVALIVGAAVISAPLWRVGHLLPFAPNGVLAIVPASLTLMWVLTGWEASTNFVGLVRDPHRRPHRSACCEPWRSGMTAGMRPGVAARRAAGAPPRRPDVADLVGQWPVPTRVVTKMPT